MSDHPTTRRTKIAPQDTTSKSLLPVVLKMIDQLNELLVEFVGPIGFELADDVFQAWLKSGKTGPSGLNRYVVELAQLIENSAERAKFMAGSEQILSKLHM
jgi:hypothetical protein